MGEHLKSLSKRTRKLFEGYDHDCIEVCENQLRQLKEEVQLLEFWAFDQSSQLEKQLHLLRNDFSEESEAELLSHSYSSLKEPETCLGYKKHFVNFCNFYFTIVSL